MMQTAKELPVKLSVGQTISMNQISLAGDKLDLVEKFLEGLGCEQNLGLAKVLQPMSWFTPTDAPLVTTETPEQALHLEIVLG
jgi:hypothetical protein